MSLIKTPLTNTWVKDLKDPNTWHNKIVFNEEVFFPSETYHFKHILLETYEKTIELQLCNIGFYTIDISMDAYVILEDKSLKLIRETLTLIVGDTYPKKYKYTLLTVDFHPAVIVIKITLGSIIKKYRVLTFKAFHLKTEFE